ncbi:MAG TPA: endonuclease/exonuclease/phosphatase family protein [Geminicoccaceae bacterium]|nr:endonuclease/exonuclease/phosphatase family protein [Geminicoccaceae bacterium]
MKLATWNMNNLHHVLGEPLRSGAPARTEADYELLRKYRDRLGADIIALQEVNGPKAAGLVFPLDQYDLYFSARYIDDLVTGKATHSDPALRSHRIYTGFAVRRACSIPSASATSPASG